VADERDGDELFEDLDKFFAPIRDVDWDEEEEAAGGQPAEEHVAVVGTEPTPAHEATGEMPTVAEEAAVEDEEDDWYDTGSVSVAELFEDEDDEESVSATFEEDEVRADDDGEEAEFGSAGEDLEEDETLEEDEDLVVVEEGPAVAEGQADLFAEEEEVLEEDEDLFASPTDEDLEAAAAHFAGSVRDEAQYDTAPVTIVAPEDEGLLADLGAPEEIEEDILSDLEPEEAPRTVVVGAEGVTGPSWQDVAAVEVGADVERRGPEPGERDVPAAFMTGVVLAGIAIAALALGPAAFAVAATAAVLVAQGELFGVMVKHHLQPATAVGLVSGALMMAGAYLKGEAATPAMFALGVVATFAWFMTVPAAHRKDVLRNIGATVFNMAWIPLLASYLIATLKLPDGEALVLTVVALTFIYDTAAFLIGSVWGGSFFRRALAPTVSPKKSLEGLIGATLVTVVVAVAFVPSFVGVFDGLKLDALYLGLVVAAAATLGDLAESLVKRDLGVKDMGSVLPGHGGILDRIDSLLFVAPAAFLLFRIVL
jgi:phosphatidate cytidylyltransferase